MADGQINILTHIGVTDELLGRAIQQGWSEWASTLPNPPAAWLRTWDEISPQMQEADKYIGKVVLKAIVNKLEAAGLSDLINKGCEYHVSLTTYNKGLVQEDLELTSVLPIIDSRNALVASAFALKLGEDETDA